MRDELTEKLRALRRKAHSLGQSLSEDLLRFLHRDKVTFRRLPTSPSLDGDVNPTTTCTALMTLSVAGSITHFYDFLQSAAKDAPSRAYSAVLSSKWESSGLPEDNVFTAAMVLRAGAFLASLGVLQNVKKMKHAHKRCEGDYKRKTVEEVAKAIAAKIPNSLKI